MRISLPFVPLLIAAALLVAGTPGLDAATFNIATGDVTGLKAAITTANSNNQDDTIILAGSGTYVLTTSAGFGAGLTPIGPDSGHSLTIQGNGALIMRSNANGIPNFRIFYIEAGSNVTLQNLTLNNGNPGSFHGGAIYEDGELGNVSLTLIGVVISSCSGDYGGAIFNDGYQDPSVPAHTATLNVIDSTFTGNTGTQYGGAIWNESGGIAFNAIRCNFISNSATLSAGAVQFDASNGVANGIILDCHFNNNSAGNFGGGVNVDGFQGNATLFIGGCYFDQNSADSGAVLAADGSSGNAVVTVRNCTLYQNSAGTNGGGIDLEGIGGNTVVNLASCTLSENSAGTAGGGVYFSQTGGGTTTLNIGNTLVNAGVSGANFASNGTATVTSAGYNLSSDAAGGGAGVGPAGFLNHAGDIRNTNPLLDPAGPKDNGGPTSTIALQATSPAIDQGNRNALAGVSVDQRNEPRSFDDPNVPNAAGGDGSDIGAYEADIRAIATSKSSSNFILQFTTVLGHTYEVQSRPSLTSGTWSTVNNTTPAPPIAGTGGVVIVTVPSAFAFSSGFYRLHQLP